MNVKAGAILDAAQPVRPAAAGTPLLDVAGLQVLLGNGAIRPVDGIDLQLAAGETLALLGESGCGKSMTALALMRLLPPGGRLAAQRMQFAGQDLSRLSEAGMRPIRGGGIGMIFQEPGTSLNPVMTLGAQIGEVLRLHRGLSGTAARDEAARLLAAVGIADPGRRLDAYPFQLSGGMKQRVMIAQALAGEPRLLIADEPTTALDVTLQAQVLDLLAALQAERGMGLLLITHDLGVVARLASRIAVMYAGQIVESGPAEAFFARPLHPYTRKLFAALPEGRRGQRLHTLPGGVPRLDRAFTGCRFVERCAEARPHCSQQVPPLIAIGSQTVRCHLHAEPGGWQWPASVAAADALTPPTAGDPVLEVQGLQLHFPVRGGLLRRERARVRAVDGVDLQLRAGQTLALVGESGCGKSSVGRAILQLEPPTAGSVRLHGQELVGASRRQLQQARRQLQMVFQDPFASLDPRMRIGESIEEGMRALGVLPDPAERAVRIDRLLAQVGLEPAMKLRYPHAFSGGQRQRIAIARALAVSPSVLICDEPTSALDVSVQAQILNLLRELQQQLGLAYLFITHNIAVVECLADEIAVMYLGRIVERGPAAEVLAAPAHPYTRMLLASVLRPELAVSPATQAAPLGELPSALAPPAGCAFHPRCSEAQPRCAAEMPGSLDLGKGRAVRCHFPLMRRV